MTAPAARCRAVTKKFGSVLALDDVSFELKPNTIHGLLGRNGAGKTTLMRVMTGQEFLTSGSVEVLGETPLENAGVLSQISFIRESQKYPDDYTVKHVLSTASYLLPHWDQNLADILLDDFQLPLKRKVKKLSRGMLSALGVIVGLASRAPLTFFDEPYLGLDAVARHMFYDRLLADYAEHPRTVVLSTHLIDEVSNLIEHVIVIDKGRILLDDSADNLRSRATVVTGEASSVAEFVGPAPVLARETLGTQARVTAELSFSELRKADAHRGGLTVEPVSLQQLVVHTTTKGAA
ncbi:ABC transporter ATP-binding protein [Hoyosella subflava]|uniref:Putative ABC transporter ATP-binding protein n=1 Tax=Hoyosella subflava (strain DSM 45089 / JCM 17490 / NBRC 109087 / DQS3-9A1) TaxID=443218 RepID=F6EIY9_HOYSD|nr:ABC transporter ATP-binding protein [Hoyosella subflava]AEF40050.1 Putative ABC transporter ATP-binding protein [Hoyosella subflava DQS3-9A1]